jgi:hypothetical protein
MTEKIDLLEIHLAGGRLNLEPSRAYPQEFYGDPAKVVMLQAESKCGECLYSRPGRAGLFCGKGQPYGLRCEFFRIAKK